MKRIVCLVALGLITTLPLLAQTPDGRNALLAPHAQDFVALQNGKVVPFKSGQYLKATYTILYFGAGWCSDCLKFSPGFVKAYDEQPKTGDRFEVLFMTEDKSADDMAKFMQKEKMNWPAIAFDKAKAPGAADLQKFHAKPVTPWLAVVDQNGKLVLESESDKNAKEVLQKVQDLVAARAKK